MTWLWIGLAFVAGIIVQKHGLPWIYAWIMATYYKATGKIPPAPPKV